MKFITQHHSTYLLAGCSGLLLLVLGWSSSTSGLSEYVQLVALLAAGALAPLVACRSNRYVTSLLILFLNAIVLLVLMSVYGSYNNLLIYGVWVMTSGLVLTWLIRPAVDIKWPEFSANLLVSVAILVAVPDINGLHFTINGLGSPSKIGIYPPQNKQTHVDPRSQTYNHARGSSRTQPNRFELHSPVAANSVDALHLLLKPASSTAYDLSTIDLVNYLGFDARRIQRLDEANLGKITTFEPHPGQQLSVTDGHLVTSKVRGHLWLEIPVTGRDATRQTSPAAHSNGWRALVYWQIVWLLCMALRPVRGLHGSDRAVS